jgi:hypothetical protein
MIGILLHHQLAVKNAVVTRTERIELDNEGDNIILESPSGSDLWEQHCVAGGSENKTSFVKEFLKAFVGGGNHATTAVNTPPDEAKKANTNGANR